MTTCTFNIDQAAILINVKMPDDITTSPSMMPEAFARMGHMTSCRSSYPHMDTGIPALPVHDLLTDHKDLIDRIKLCYGIDRMTFERDVLSLIERYASFVHLLPATANNYFNAPGGLLRLGLETAFFSLQGTDGHIFSGRATITMRRQLEPRWRHATFIAGLCSEMYRTLSHVRVSNEHGEQWQACLCPLSEWLERNQVQSYSLKWLPNAHETRALGLFALPHILPTQVLQDLALENTVIVPHLMASISGMSLYREHNIIDELVKRSAALVIDRDLQANTDRDGKSQLGSHIDRYLVDALRRLTASNTSWFPNNKNSRVWYGADGLFIIWPNAAVDIKRLIEEDQLPGIPKTPEAILEILLQAGIIELKNDFTPLWNITTPSLRTPQEAIKLTSPAILFADNFLKIEPLTFLLLDPGNEKADLTEKQTPKSPPSPISKEEIQNEAPLSVASKETRQLVLELDKTERQQTIKTPQAQQQPIAVHANVPSSESPAPAKPIPALKFKLEAPMRLNPTVRETLTTIVDRLNHRDDTSNLYRVPRGLFIPLIEFEQRQLDPSMAIRVLRDVQMLILPKKGGIPTFSNQFGNETKIGLILAPEFISGLDKLPLFQPGDTHADSTL